MALCYRDMTFCNHWRDCAKASECNRPATDEVKVSAKRFGLPLATFLNKPECHELITDEEGSSDE